MTIGKSHWIASTALTRINQCAVCQIKFLFNKIPRPSLIQHCLWSMSVSNCSSVFFYDNEPIDMGITQDHTFSPNLYSKQNYTSWHALGPLLNIFLFSVVGWWVLTKLTDNESTSCSQSVVGYNSSSLYFSVILHTKVPFCVQLYCIITAILLLHYPASLYLCGAYWHAPLSLF